MGSNLVYEQETSGALDEVAFAILGNEPQSTYAAFRKITEPQLRVVAKNTSDGTEGVNIEILTTDKAHNTIHFAKRQFADPSVIIIPDKHKENKILLKRKVSVDDLSRSEKLFMRCLS